MDIPDRASRLERSVLLDLGEAGFFEITDKCGHFRTFQGRRAFGSGLWCRTQATLDFLKLRTKADISGHSRAAGVWIGVVVQNTGHARFFEITDKSGHFRTFQGQRAFGSGLWCRTQATLDFLKLRTKADISGHSRAACVWIRVVVQNTGHARFIEITDKSGHFRTFQGVFGGQPGLVKPARKLENGPSFIFSRTVHRVASLGSLRLVISANICSIWSIHCTG